MEDVGEDRRDREDQSEGIEPERGADVVLYLGAQVLAEAKLQQESGESDRGHHHQGERAGEGGAAGIDDDQSEREQEQSGGNDRPAARLPLWLGLGRGGRVGSGVGQGVPSQVIQGGARGLQSNSFRY